MHLCAELTAAFWTLEPFGEIGANFSLQLSSRTRFDKINKKKVIAENQCEKHKKSSLVIVFRATSNNAQSWCNMRNIPGRRQSIFDLRLSIELTFSIAA